MSPGGQTPLLSRCLFSAAFADSPAEEVGREVIKEQKEKTEGVRGKKREQKIKLIKKLNKGRKKVCAQQAKSCLLKGKMTSSVLATGLPLACHKGSGKNSSVAASQLGFVCTRSSMCVLFL